MVCSPWPSEARGRHGASEREVGAARVPQRCIAGLATNTWSHGDSGMRNKLAGPAIAVVLTVEGGAVRRGDERG